jgi:hypothetical protein
MHIRFKQSHTHFAHRGINIVLGKFPATAELIKYTVESIC